MNEQEPIGYAFEKRDFIGSVIGAKGDWAPHEVPLYTTPPDTTRLETEYTAATLRINNDLLVIAELTAQLETLRYEIDAIPGIKAERDAYAKAADDMAASHKVERDELSRLYENALKREYALHEAAKLALDAILELRYSNTTHAADAISDAAIEALKKAGVTP